MGFSVNLTYSTFLENAPTLTLIKDNMDEQNKFIINFSIRLQMNLPLVIYVVMFKGKGLTHENMCLR